MIVHKIMKSLFIFLPSVYSHVYGFFCVKDQSFILDTFRIQELRSGTLQGTDLLTLNQDSWFSMYYLLSYLLQFIRHNKTLWSNKKVVGLKKYSYKVHYKQVHCLRSIHKVLLDEIFEHVLGIVLISSYELTHLLLLLTDL